MSVQSQLVCYFYSIKKVSVHDIHSGDSLFGNHSFPFLWVMTAEIGSDQEKTPPLIFYELSKTVFKFFLAQLGPKLDGGANFAPPPQKVVEN